MADGGQSMYVDVDGLKKGGVDLGEIGRVVDSIRGELQNKILEHKGFGGGGQIGQAVKLNYTPTEEAGMEFLGGLSETIASHGEKTTNVAKGLDDVNTDATHTAGQAPTTTHTGKH